MDPWVIYHNENQQPPPGVKRTIEQKHPALVNSSWQCIRSYCPLIKQWNAIRLSLYQNYYKNIIKEMYNFLLPNLIYISLAYNQIHSIESLDHIYMPLLQKLKIKHNKISSFKILRKKIWKNLQQIDIQENKHSQIDFIEFLANDGLEYFHLDGYGKSFNVSIRNIVKMRNKTLKYLYIDGRNRICQPDLESQIENKYPDIKIRSRLRPLSF